MSAVRVELELNDGTFTTRMLHAGETVEQFRNSVGQGITTVRQFSETTTSFVGTLRDLTVVIGMAHLALENIRSVTTGWAADIIKVNAEMEKLTFLLRGMSVASDASKDAGDQVKYLREQAKNAPFALKELTDTFVKMKSTGVDPLAGGFKAMVDGVAAFGGTDDVLKRATIAITQMAGKGVIQMEELRQQLGEAMPRAVEIMARSMGETTGQLISDISKGTLEAKHALSAFFLESERTFGGAAAEQMKTFNGRLSQMHTLLQSLALNAGDAGFFDAVKQQLGDINHFLGGGQAQQVAQMMGRGLTVVVQDLRAVIDGTLRWHNELIAVAEVAGVVFGGKMLIGGISGLMGYFGGLITQTRSFGLALVTVGEQWQMVNFGRMVNQITAGANGFSMFEGVVRRTAAVLPLISAGLAFTGNVIIPVVGGLIAAAYAFGLFSDKVKDAYENLQKFGAQSRADADPAKQMADRLRREIAQLEYDRKNAQVADAENPYAKSASEYDSEILKKKEALRKAEDEYKKQLGVGANRERDSELQAMNEKLDERLFQSSKAYDEEAKVASKAYNDQRNILIAAKQDTSVLDAAYNRAHLEGVLKSLDDEYNLRNDWMNAIDNQAKEGNDKAILISEKFHKQQIDAMLSLQEKRNIVQDEGMKAEILGKPINIQQLLQRGAGMLDKVKEDIVGYRAELAGASSEWAKLVYRIEDAASKQQTLGPQANALIHEQTDELRAQVKVRDVLAQQVEGQKKLDAAINTLNEQATQKLDEAMNNGKSPFDQFFARLKDGTFSGLSPIEQSLANIKDNGKSAADAIKGAFSSDMTSGVAAFLTPLQQVAAQMGVIAVEGNKIFTNGTGASISTAAGSGFNGKSYQQNLYAFESGGNLNGTNTMSSAAGPAQFIKSTWLDFLKQMHPEIGGSQEQKLGLRNSSELNTEAVAWLNSGNAAALMKKGIDTNDSNMYLAHFLGAGGAIDVLTKSADTALRSIPSLSKAIEKNPGVFDKVTTVGDLQGFVQRRFGTAHTAMTAEGDPNMVSDMLNKVGGADTPQGQRLQAAFMNFQRAQLQGMENTRKKMLQDFALDAEQSTDGEGKNKNLAEAMRAIRAGKLGTSRDPEEYSDVLELARKKDVADNTANERKKLRSSFDQKGEDQDKQLEVFDQRIAELKRQIESNQKFTFSSKYFQAVGAQTANDVRLDKGKQLGVFSGDEIAGSRSKAAEAVRLQGNEEVVAAVAAEQQKTKAMERAAMTSQDARNAELRDTVEKNQTLLALYQGSGQERVMIEQQTARNIAAARRQAFDSTPIGGMLKQWRDGVENLQRASVGWMNNFNDRLTDLVMRGRTNWRSLTMTISQDLIKLGIQAAESKLFGSILGFGGTATSAATVGVDGLAAIHHTGGVAGAIMPYRQVSMSLFENARRYHTGGIVGDEIPIIARRGEEVGWPGQMMAKYGGSGGSNIQFGDIHLHGSPQGGNPAQNKDYAKMMMAQLREAAGKMIGDELRKQTRPGGLLKG